MTNPKHVLKLMGIKILTILPSEKCTCLFILFSGSVSGNVVADVSTSQGINLWRYQAPNSYLGNATENPCQTYSLECVIKI